ncbi:MAG: PQQ-binding-like beta-propeller repeat protein [Pirellulales bacterium]|nr:PQQ-binding-like beta-propeller repeat protein [Pirellulales bacterium]
MTDAELIELLENKLPQELSAAEIAQLRSHLDSSGKLQTVLRDRLRMDQSLAQILGYIDLRPEQILARANRASPRGNPWVLWGMALALLLLCGIWIKVWLDQAEADLALKVQPVTAPAADPALAPPPANNNQANPAPANPLVSQAPPANNNAHQDNPAHATQPDTAGGTMPPAQNQIGAQPPRQRDGWVLYEAEKYHAATGLAPINEGDTSFLRPTRDKSTVEYKIQAPVAGDYRLQLRYRNLQPAPLRLWVNEKLVENDLAGATMPGFSGDFAEGWTPSLKINLTAGENTLRLESRSRKQPELQLFPDLDALALQPVAAANTVASRPENRPPWTRVTHLDRAPRSLWECACEPVASWGKPPGKSDLESWLEPVQDFRIDMTQRWQFNYCIYDGAARLRAKLQPNQALRLAFSDTDNRFCLHLWEGDRGYTLRLYEHQRNTWVAYRTTRKAANEPRPAEFLFAGSDGERNLRLHNGDLPQRIDLLWTGQHLVLSRMGIPLLQVPFTTAPEIILDGRALVQGISLVPVLPRDKDPWQVEIARLDQPPPVTKELKRLDQLNWKLEFEPNKGVEWIKHPTGAVELSARERTEKHTWATVDWDMSVPAILEFDVETPQPGARLILATSDGQPKYGIGNFRDNHSQRQAWEFVSPYDNRYEVDHNVRDRVAASAGTRTWVRVLQSPGMLRMWLSQDGENWGSPFDPMQGTDGGCTRFGIMIPQSDRPRGIILHQVRIRAFPYLEKYALADRTKLQPLEDFKNVQNEAGWKELVQKTKPADLDEKTWQRACLVETVRLGKHREYANPQLLSLFADLYAELAQLPPGEQLDQQLLLLDTIAALAHTWMAVHDYPAEERFLPYYERITRQLALRGEPRAWSRVWPHYVMADFNTWDVRQRQWSSLYLQELLEAIYRVDLPASGVLLGAGRGLYPRLELLSWGDAWLASQLPPAQRRDDTHAPQNDLYRRVDLRHPYREEINKEGYNFIAELQSAIGSKAYRDACQLITNAHYDDKLGLLPSQRDPQLYYSVPVAVTVAVREDPELHRVLSSEFAPLGMLKYHQAEQAADPRAMLALTVQYGGTPAAAAAHHWLGDRELSGGDFAAAQAHYQAALGTSDGAAQSQLSAKIRYVAALAGERIGQAPAQAVQLADQLLPAADFEKLIQNLLDGQSAAPGAIHPAPLPVALPDCDQVEIKPIGSIEAAAGDNLHDFPAVMNDASDGERLFDWVPRIFHGLPAGNDVVLANRFQITAYEQPTGKMRWISENGNDRPRVHDWPLVPMRPVIQGDKIYVRRLRRTGPELACVKTDGQVQWQTHASLTPISDPLITPRGIQVLTIARGETESQIYLCALSAQTGQVLRQTPLFTVNPCWDDQHTAEWISTGERIYGVCTGFVFCLDWQGELRWVRKQLWLGQREKRDWGRQAMQSPYLCGGKLLIQQPGVPAVEALDPDSGLLLWRIVLPDVRAILGCVGDRLLIQDETGITAYTAAGGKYLWSLAIPQMLAGVQLSASGNCWFTRAVKEKDRNEKRVELVGFDPATGVIGKAISFPDYLHDKPNLGPIIFLGNNRWWAFGQGGDKEPRRTIYEIKPK